MCVDVRLQMLMTGQKDVVAFQKHYTNGTTVADYQKFASDFHAELWDPNDWMDLFTRAGARVFCSSSLLHIREGSLDGKLPKLYKKRLHFDAKHA